MLNNSYNRAAYLESLDLAPSRRKQLSDVQQINLIIQSLKKNCFTYGKSLRNHSSDLDRNDIDKVYVIPRLALPRMKNNSYKIWENFLNATVQFFDGKNRTDYIKELLQLENLVKQTRAKDTTSELETIFSQFELISGFSTVHTILPADGQNGLLSAEQFKAILASGHPINDCGASLHHGKLPHRLQFYILGQYLNKNIHKFFSPNDLDELTKLLAEQYPDLVNTEGNFPNHKIISAFYRLLGNEAFNNCFDWEDFSKKREQSNLKYNGKPVSEKFNLCEIWVQLFDRYGYAGFFSVPSSVGLLQKLGCFRNLPIISKPNLLVKKELKTILDVTPKLTF